MKKLGRPKTGMTVQTRVKYTRLAGWIQRGYTVRETASKNGVSESTVIKACNCLGVVRKRRPGENALSARSYRIIAEIVNGNQTYQEIADESGVTSAHVRGIASRLRRAGCRAVAARPAGIPRK